MRHLIPLTLLLALLSCGNNDSLTKPEPITDIQPLYSINDTASITFHVNDNGEVVIIIPAKELAEVLSPYLADNDIYPPVITSSTVANWQTNINPRAINNSGIRIDFSEAITGSIWITDEAGVDLAWISAVALNTAILVPPHGRELQFGSTYIIHLDISDHAGNNLGHNTITFQTKEGHGDNINTNDKAENDQIIPLK